MAAVYFGNRATSLRVARQAMEELGIRVEGPVLAGEVSVREGQQLSAEQAAQRGNPFWGEREGRIDFVKDGGSAGSHR